MNPISRTQAWCKLAVLIADGMPAPTQIAVDKHGVVICLDTVAAIQAWAEKLSTRTPSAPHRGEKRWSYTASGEWCGMDLVLSAHVPPPEPEPITEDMSKVREIAGAVSE